MRRPSCRLLRRALLAQAPLSRCRLSSQLSTNRIPGGEDELPLMSVPPQGEPPAPVPSGSGPRDGGIDSPRAASPAAPSFRSPKA
jgi:hypothetical protein